MLERLSAWLRTFTGCMFMAVLSFTFLVLDISNGDEFFAWMMGLVTLVWLYGARRALKDKNTIAEHEAELTPDQRQRIRDATKVFADTLKEVDQEVADAKAEAIAKALIEAKEKANDKANKNSDNDAT